MFSYKKRNSPCYFVSGGSSPKPLLGFLTRLYYCPNRFIPTTRLGMKQELVGILVSNALSQNL